MHWMQYVRTAVRRPQKAYTLADIATHTDPRRSVWMAIHGRVYDVTAYLRYHPGGIPQLMKGAGKDCTKMFGQFGRAETRGPPCGWHCAQASARCGKELLLSFLDADLTCPHLFLSTFFFLFLALSFLLFCVFFLFFASCTDKVHAYVNLDLMMAPLQIGTLVADKK